MRRALATVAAAAVCSVAYAAEPAASDSAATVAAAEQKLQATFKSFEFEEIRASEIPGIVEIYAGPRVFYYAPKQELLLIGELYTQNGISLTEQKLAERAAEKAASLDRSTAVVLGDGPRELIAFVDPDCGYCKAAYRYLAQQSLSGTRVLLFFTPLTGRPVAEARALETLCADPARRPVALRRAFDPAPGEKPDLEARCPSGVAALKAHAALSQKVGVYATPFFLAGGEVIAGFDKARLDTWLSAAPGGAARTAASSNK